MDIYIKNMVCQRCVMVVSQLFEKAGIETQKITLGKVETARDLLEKEIETIDAELRQVGFEVINDSKRQTIEKIKNIAIRYIYENEGDKNINFSHYLSSEMMLDYPYLSTLFSSAEGITIEKYLINLKIERVKELLVYDEKTLSEIAWELSYSSVAHLSGQFKKVSGFTPSYFKKLGQEKRKPLNEL